MKYSIVISTKDRPEALKDLINSIKLFTGGYELLIHDDAKTHMSVADAWNKQIEKAKGDYIQVLNDDMIVSPNWLDSNKFIYELLEEHYNVPGVIQSKTKMGDVIQSRGGAFLDDNLIPVPPPDTVKQIDYSNTPFFRKSVWEDVGGFTAFDTMYYEDTDFGLKCLKKGYTNWYNPNSIIYHTTLGSKPEHGRQEVEKRMHNESIVQKQSREKFMKKWRTWLTTKHTNLFT